jgi:hypothetical protein
MPELRRLFEARRLWLVNGKGPAITMKKWCSAIGEQIDLEGHVSA